jgi:hypothetical protein
LEPNVHFPTTLPLVHRNLTFYLQLSSSRGGILGVRTKLRAEYPTNVVRFLAKVRGLLLLKSVQTGPVSPTQASCIMGNGTLSPGKKVVARRRPPDPPSTKVTYQLHLHYPIFLHGVHRNTFIFTVTSTQNISLTSISSLRTLLSEWQTKFHLHSKQDQQTTCAKTVL